MSAVFDHLDTSAQKVHSIHGRGEPPPRESHDISDGEFMEELKRLRSLRSFLQKSAVTLNAEGRDACKFGHLNLLRSSLRPTGGRPPTLDEWTDLEIRTQVIWELLPESSRRKFVLGEIPWWVSHIIGLLAVVALGSLVLLTLDVLKPLLAYMFWLTALGGMGAVSFIAMNALSVQEDATFDLTNSRLIWLRIALGALLGVVIALPFGFDQFRDFHATTLSSKVAPPEALRQQALWLLLPFLLGFSTSLVIMILNRFVEAVQTIFGKIPSDVSVKAPLGAQRGKNGNESAAAGGLHIQATLDETARKSKPRQPRPAAPMKPMGEPVRPEVSKGQPERELGLG